MVVALNLLKPWPVFSVQSLRFLHNFPRPLQALWCPCCLGRGPSLWWPWNSPPTLLDFYWLCKALFLHALNEILPLTQTVFSLACIFVCFWFYFSGDVFVTTLCGWHKSYSQRGTLSTFSSPCKIPVRVGGTWHMGLPWKGAGSPTGSGRVSHSCMKRSFCGLYSAHAATCSEHRSMPLTIKRPLTV